MRLGGRSHPSGYGHSSGVAAHLAITTAVAISLGALVFLLPSQFDAVKGFALGAWTAFVITSAYNWCMIASGASQSMMGEQGEVWTDGELRSLRKRGWRVVNHLTLKHGDIDHVAIGPGGLMVIESKWNSSPLALDGTDRWVGNWADQARRNTDDVKRFIGWGARADAPISPSSSSGALTSGRPLTNFIAPTTASPSLPASGYVRPSTTSPTSARIETKLSAPTPNSPSTPSAEIVRTSSAMGPDPARLTRS